MFGISFINSNIGWAVGLGGIILKTSNGGLNWSLQASGTSNQLNSVSFIDTLRGWCCGGTKIFQTFDGGNTWTLQYNATPNNLNCIQMLNSKVGFTCGSNGSVYKYNCVPSNINLNQSLCLGQSFTIGTQSFNTAGSYSVPLISAGGCDSIVHLNLTVNPLPVPVITQNGNSLSTGNFTSYQWLYNGGVINGQTFQNLTPTFNGNYSVIVTNTNGCSDTSAIFQFTIGIEELFNESSVLLFPNPTTSDVNVTFPLTTKQIQITNSIGQILKTKILSGQTTEKFRLEENGVYFIKITTDKNTTTRKIIVCR